MATLDVADVFLVVACVPASKMFIQTCRNFSLAKSLLLRGNHRNQVVSCFTVYQRIQTTSCNFEQENRKSLSVESNKTQISKDVKPVTERIKQTTKDAANISVILAGLGVAAVIFYAVFKEFFSSKSPTSVFTQALKKCKNDPRVTEALGAPIKGRGEMTSRGRARHVSFAEYEKNGKTYLRLKFYLRGSINSATVQCETTRESYKSYFRYLFVELDTYPHKVIIVEDNRLIDDEQ